MLVSAILLEAVTHIHISLLSWASRPAPLHPSGSSQSTKLSSMCYTAASQSLFVLSDRFYLFIPPPQSGMPFTHLFINLYLWQSMLQNIFWKSTKDFVCPSLDTAPTLLLCVPLLAADPSRGLPHRRSLWCFWQFLKGSCDSTRHISYFI